MPYSARMPPTIRPIEPRDLSEIRAELQKHWGSTEIWSLGRCHKADALPGFVAEAAKLNLPLRPLIGDDYAAMMAADLASLRSLWARRPWKE